MSLFLATLAASNFSFSFFSSQFISRRLPKALLLITSLPLGSQPLHCSSRPSRLLAPTFPPHPFPTLSEGPKGKHRSKQKVDSGAESSLLSGSLLFKAWPSQRRSGALKRWILIIYSAFLVVLRRTIGTLYAPPSRLRVEVSTIFKLCSICENSFSLVANTSTPTRLGVFPHYPSNLKR